MRAPAGVLDGLDGLIKVEISAINGQHESWEKPVHAYFRRSAEAWQLVGFERLPE